MPEFQQNSMIFPDIKEFPENSRFPMFFQGIDTLNKHCKIEKYLNIKNILYINAYLYEILHKIEL